MFMNKNYVYVANYKDKQYFNKTNYFHNYFFVPKSTVKLAWKGNYCSITTISGAISFIAEISSSIVF